MSITSIRFGVSNRNPYLQPGQPVPDKDLPPALRAINNGPFGPITLGSDGGVDVDIANLLRQREKQEKPPAKPV